MDPHLVRAVIKVESDFNPHARSHKGAQGLMQLMPDTARLRNISNVYDPDENIDTGVHHIKLLLDRYQGNLPFHPFLRRAKMFGGFLAIINVVARAKRQLSENNPDGRITIRTLRSDWRERSQQRLCILLNIVVFPMVGYSPGGQFTRFSRSG